MPNEFLPKSSYVILVGKYKELKKLNPFFTQKDFCRENDINYSVFCSYAARDKYGPKETMLEKERRELVKAKDSVPDVLPPSYYNRIIQGKINEAS